MPGVVDALSLFGKTDLTAEGIRKDTIDLQNIVTQYYSDSGGWFNYLYESDILEAQQVDKALQRFSAAQSVSMDPLKIPLVTTDDVIKRRTSIEKALRIELDRNGAAAGKSYRLKGPITFMDCTQYPSTQFSSSFCDPPPEGTDARAPSVPPAGTNEVREKCVDDEKKFSIDPCLLKPEPGAAIVEDKTGRSYGNLTYTQDPPPLPPSPPPLPPAGDFPQPEPSLTTVGPCKCPQYDEDVCRQANTPSPPSPRLPPSASPSPPAPPPPTCVGPDWCVGPRDSQGKCTKGCGDCDYGMACVGPAGSDKGQCTSFIQSSYKWTLPTPGEFCSAQIPGTQPTFIFKVEKETNPTAGYRLKNVTEDSGQRMDADTIVRCEFVYQ